MALAAGWLYFRAELRRRWRAWLALALIVGAFAGVVEAAAAGARRTDAAYPSLLAWSDAPDLLLFSSARTSKTFGQFSLRAAAAVPQARHSAVLVGYSVTTPAAAQIIAPVTNVVPGRFWHRRILSGRLPDPARPHEVSIAFTLAQSADLHAGDTLRTTLLSRSGRPVPYTFRITGIDATPAEFPPQTGSGTETIWATPAFYRAHRSGFTQSAGVALRLWHGEADLPAVQRELSRLTRGKVLQNYPLSTQAVNTERSIHLQAVALWLVAALLGVISLLVLGQLLARMSFLDSVEYRTLRALGISRRTLLAIGFLRAAVIGTGGAVVGTLTALAISPLLPVGLAAVAEPDPGIRADGLVFGVGVAAAVLITIAATAWPTWRAASAGPAMDGLGRPAPAGPGGRRRPQYLAALTSGIGLVPAMLGIRLALQPGAGRTAVPVRSTVASAVVAVAAVTGALVFSASLGHLLTTPRLYGVTWDAYVSNAQQRGVEGAIRGLADRPGVAAWSAGYSGVPLTVAGVRADGIAMQPGHRGDLRPVPMRGHLPSGPGEIAVGEGTLAAMHARVGQTVRVSLAGFPSRPFRVVGTAVFPTLGDTLGLGKGATLMIPGLRRLLPLSVPAPPLDTLLVRFGPGAGGTAGLNAFSARAGRLGAFVVERPTTPIDVVNFGRVQQLPLLLGIALSLLALLTLVHLLLTSVRRRRRDFAVLRSIGFTRSQVRAAISWQAFTLTGVALALGIPAGILCGRVAWRLFAGQLGILPVVVLPVILVLVVPAALALAVAVAAVPGESAARARPAEILRSE
jgi:ABC-type lipoprotein release transport system permease subunit